MEGELARVAARQRGFVYRWQALDCGVSPAEIEARLRSRDWRRIRRGAYAPGDVLDGLDAAGRHVLLVRAVVGNLAGDVVVSHTSALAVLGVPMWDVDLREVHVHRSDDRTSRRAAGVVHHLGALPESEVVERDGLLVCTPERSVVDACRTVSFEAGVVLADGAEREVGMDLVRADRIVEQERDWAGSIRAARVLRFCDGRAQTVGESRCRVLLARVGVPEPVLQHPLRDAAGRLLGIADFYVEEHETVVEFDGRHKYGRELYEASDRPGPVDLGDVVWREKRREDAIRDTGVEVVRVVWSELDGHDDAVRRRLDRAFRRGARHRSTA